MDEWMFIWCASSNDQYYYILFSNTVHEEHLPGQCERLEWTLRRLAQFSRKRNAWEILFGYWFERENKPYYLNACVRFFGGRGMRQNKILIKNNTEMLNIRFYTWMWGNNSADHVWWCFSARYGREVNQFMQKKWSNIRVSAGCDRIRLRHCEQCFFFCTIHYWYAFISSG